MHPILEQRLSSYLKITGDKRNEVLNQALSDWLDVVGDTKLELMVERQSHHGLFLVN